MSVDLSALGAYRAKFTLAYQVSPIILQGGIAASAPGGLLPIVALYGQLDQFNSTSTAVSPNDFFAQYVPLPGSTLINQSIASYPFANQQIAANATIQQPLTLSMLMIAPVNTEGGYQTKLTLFSSLQRSLQQHNNAGGVYNVATPAFIYSNLILITMADASENDGNSQRQILYQLDFVQPLLTIEAAAAAQNNFMARTTNGGQLNASNGWGSANPGLPSYVTGMPAAVIQPSSVNNGGGMGSINAASNI